MLRQGVLENIKYEILRYTLLESFGVIVSNSHGSLLILMFPPFELSTARPQSRAARVHKLYTHANCARRRSKRGNGNAKDVTCDHKRNLLHLVIMTNTNFHYGDDDIGAEMIDMLVQKGADVNARDKSGVSPLEMSIYYFKPEIAKKLIGYSADPKNIKCKRDYFNPRSENPCMSCCAFTHSRASSFCSCRCAVKLRKPCSTERMRGPALRGRTAILSEYERRSKWRKSSSANIHYDCVRYIIHTPYVPLYFCAPVHVPALIAGSNDTRREYICRISYLTAENERLERQLRTEAEPCKDCTSSPLQVHIKTLNWQISQLKTQNQTYAETLKDVSRFCDRVYKSLSAYTKHDKTSYPRTTRSRSVNSLRGSDTVSTSTTATYDTLGPILPVTPSPQATSTPNGAVAKRVMKRRPKSSIVDNTVIGVYKPPTPVAEIDSDELPPEKLLNEAHNRRRPVSATAPAPTARPSSPPPRAAATASVPPPRPTAPHRARAPAAAPRPTTSFDHLDHEIITDEYCDYVAEIKTARLVRRTNDSGDGVDFESTVAEAPRKTYKTYISHKKDNTSLNQSLGSEKSDRSIAETSKTGSSSFEVQKNLSLSGSEKNVNDQAQAKIIGNETSTPKFSKATVKASIKRLRDWTFNETETQDSKTVAADTCSRSVTDDESGFSSLSSFQEIGLPQVQNNNNNHGSPLSSSSPIKKTGSHTEVGLPEVPLRAAIHHRRWSSTPSEVKAMFRRHSSINRASETMSVWVGSFVMGSISAFVYNHRRTLPPDFFESDPTRTKGDSGGPVVDENNIQFGVLSFNLDCGTAAPVPSGMTDVRKWIKATLEDQWLMKTMSKLALLVLIWIVVLKHRCQVPSRM
ncbi:unnamed protein product [Trichogramma brassicae]|uniref:Peptidase S1 domain-containing protein n=1 Tax=Trichogramma brassicae TaxID=86971 RepID=A0A6H5IKG2_9HYME|nr:unnamed protein product [Trichogramma brassicae]